MYTTIKILPNEKKSPYEDTKKYYDTLKKPECLSTSHIELRRILTAHGQEKVQEILMELIDAERTKPLSDKKHLTNEQRITLAWTSTKPLNMSPFWEWLNETPQPPEGADNAICEFFGIETIKNNFTEFQLQILRHTHNLNELHKQK